MKRLCLLTLLFIPVFFLPVSSSVWATQEEEFEEEEDEEEGSEDDWADELDEFGGEEDYPANSSTLLPYPTGKKPPDKLDPDETDLGEVEIDPDELVMGPGPMLPMSPSMDEALQDDRVRPALHQGLDRDALEDAATSPPGPPPDLPDIEIPTQTTTPTPSQSSEDDSVVDDLAPVVPIA